MFVLVDQQLKLSSHYKNLNKTGVLQNQIAAFWSTTRIYPTNKFLLPKHFFKCCLIAMKMARSNETETHKNPRTWPDKESRQTILLSNTYLVGSSLHAA